MWARVNSGEVHALAVAYVPDDEDSYGYPSLEAAHARKAVLTASDFAVFSNSSALDTMALSLHPIRVRSRKQWTSCTVIARWLRVWERRTSVDALSFASIGRMLSTP